MLNVNRSVNHAGSSPPLYKGNLAARQTELTIFVFANGDEAVCNQAKRFELCKFDLLAWNPTLDAIATRMGLRKKGLKSLYTRGGKRINGYWELMDGGCYVGVGPHERFRKLNYNDPTCELFKSKTQARKTEKEDEVKVFNREMPPFYCSTSTPILNLIQDPDVNYHRLTKDSPFHSTKTYRTRSPAKPSKSVEELRRIYNGSNAQRSRRVLTSSIPYYKRVKPEENDPKNDPTRSSSLNLAGESTKTKIRNFTSKYLPYYSKLQQNFLDETCTKQANQKRLLPNAKSVPSKPPNVPVHTNTPPTNPSLHGSAAVMSDTSTVVRSNTPADMPSRNSDTVSSQTAHVNTPANMSSQSSVGPLSHTSLTTPGNALANMSSQSSVGPLSKTSLTAPSNTPANMSSHSSVTILSRTAHMNTLANISSQSSYAVLSKTSRTAYTNVSSQSSFAVFSKSSRNVRTDGPTNMSSHVSVTMFSTSSGTADVDGPTETPAQVRASVAPVAKRPRLEASGRNAPLPGGSLTCVAMQKPEDATQKIQKPDRATGRVKSLSYFLDLADEGGMLEEWGEEDRPALDSDCSEETNRNEVVSRELHQSDNIAHGWSNERPSTRSTEYPEETDETLVDYWFMSEDEFEDESSDDVEEEGLKMKFLQLD